MENEKLEEAEHKRGKSITPIDMSMEDKALRDLRFPETLAFPIHKDFRLWLSTFITPDFPTAIARKCNKIVLELPSSMRLNCIHTLNHADNSLFNQGDAH